MEKNGNRYLTDHSPSWFLPLVLFFSAGWVLNTDNIWEGHSLFLSAAALAMIGFLLTNRWLTSLFLYLSIWLLASQLSLILADSDAAAKTAVFVHKAVITSVGWFMVGGILFVYASRLNCSFNMLSCTIVAIAVMESLIFCSQLLGFDPVLGLLKNISTNYAAVRHVGPAGTIGNPNIFGGFMALSLPFAWYIMRDSRLSVIIILLINAFIVLSNSSTALGSSAIGIFVLAFLTKDKKIIILSVLIAIIGLVWFFGFDKGLYELSGKLQATGEGARLLTWKSTILAWTKHPFIGWGPGSWNNDWTKIKCAECWWDWSHAHNEFLEFIYETGLIGFALLSCYLFSLLNRARYLSNNPEVNALICLVAISATLCLGSFPMHLAATATTIIVGVARLEATCQHDKKAC